MVGCIRDLNKKTSRCKEISDIESFINHAYNINTDTTLIFYKHTIKEVEEYINNHSNEISIFEKNASYTIDKLEDIISKKIILVKINDYHSDINNIVSLYKQLSTMYDKMFNAYGIIYP